jgi:hypothetical protein
MVDWGHVFNDPIQPLVIMYSPLFTKIVSANESCVGIS